MAQSVATVKIDDKPLKNLLKQLKGNRGAFDRMFKQWGIIYLAAMRRRFRNFSRGQGSWPALAEVTIARKGSSSILIDKGFLFNALTPGGTGNLFKRTRNGLQVGMLGTGSHPAAGLSIAELADIHHTGKGNSPSRPLIDAPNAPTIRLFIKAAERAVIAAAKKG